MEEMTIDFLDGYLDAISEGCGGTDYVPIYGVESFSMESDEIRDSLKKHLNKDFSKRGDVSNYQDIPTSQWKEKLKHFLEKWIDQRYFEGQGSKLGEVFNDFMAIYKESIEEYIIYLVGKHPKCFTASISHEKYGYDCEAIGFIEKDKAFFLYFGWSD